MQVSLSPELERFVEEKLQRGEFASPSEVVSNALSLWKAQEELTPEDLDQLRAEIAVGLQQSRRGESAPLDMDSVRTQVRRLRRG